MFWALIGIVVLFGLAVLVGGLVALLRPMWEKHDGTPRLRKSHSRLAAPAPRQQAQASASPPGVQPAAPLDEEPSISVSISFEPSFDELAASSSPSWLEWKGHGQPITLKGITIPEPLTYVVGERPRHAQRGEPSAIDPTLTVARSKPEPAAGLPYWPSYEGLMPGHRRVYLEWMAGGRRMMPPEIGYAFIFFYGLERRALVDEADHAQVFNEVFRLRMLNGKPSGERFSWSFDSYSSSLLWYLAISFPAKVTEKAIRLLMETTHSWGEDAISAALAWFVLNNRPLPDWAAHAVARQLPGCQRSVVVTRVADEFSALFAKRYAERFGEGLVVKSAKRDRTYVHRPGSAALRQFERHGPNPMGLASQFDELSKVWNACVEDLRRLSSVVKKQGQEAVTPAAWEAMPPELRAGVEHPMTDAICSLVSESVMGRPKPASAGRLKTSHFEEFAVCHVISPVPRGTRNLGTLPRYSMRNLGTLPEKPGDATQVFHNTLRNKDLRCAVATGREKGEKGSWTLF